MCRSSIQSQTIEARQRVPSLLRLERGKAEFFVGWFFYGRGGGDVFSCELLARLGCFTPDSGRSTEP